MKKLFLLIILLGIVAYALYHVDPQQSSRSASPQVVSVGVSVDSVVGPPTVTAAKIEGIGTPASTRARLAALRHAARRAPSRLRTCSAIEIVERGYR